MPDFKRIFFIADYKNYTEKQLKCISTKLVKGFIRGGFDVRQFPYGTAFWKVSPVMSKICSRRWCKHKVDNLLLKQLRICRPELVIVMFANFLDAETIGLIRAATPDAFLLGVDVDLWPELHEGRIEIAKKLDMVVSTACAGKNNIYKKEGVRCEFFPYPCDPDIEHPYEVDEDHKCDVIFTGKVRDKTSRYPVDDSRKELLKRVSKIPNSRVCGSFGEKRVSGMDYLYSISGARMGLSVNAANDVRMCHSDRFITYLACGTFVLAKRVPDSDLLFEDRVHLRYFDTPDEFEELARYYLEHEDERKKIAHAGMLRAHAEFNCEKIAGYLIDLVEKGSYSAPWNSGC